MASGNRNDYPETIHLSNIDINDDRVIFHFRDLDGMFWTVPSELIRNLEKWVEDMKAVNSLVGIGAFAKLCYTYRSNFVAFSLGRVVMAEYDKGVDKLSKLLEEIRKLPAGSAGNEGYEQLWPELLNARYDMLKIIIKSPSGLIKLVQLGNIEYAKHRDSSGLWPAKHAAYFLSSVANHFIASIRDVYAEYEPPKPGSQFKFLPPSMWFDYGQAVREENTVFGSDDSVWFRFYLPINFLKIVGMAELCLQRDDFRFFENSSSVQPTNATLRALQKLVGYSEMIGVLSRSGTLWTPDRPEVRWEGDIPVAPDKGRSGRRSYPSRSSEPPNLGNNFRSSPAQARRSHYQPASREAQFAQIGVYWNDQTGAPSADYYEPSARDERTSNLEMMMEGLHVKR